MWSYRYAERGELIWYICACKDADIYDVEFGKESPSDVGICCTVYREGMTIFQSFWSVVC